MEPVAECVSRRDPRSALLRNARTGGTRCHQRVGNAALPPEIPDLAMGAVLRTSRSSLAAREGIVARAGQRVPDFIRRWRELL